MKFRGTLTFGETIMAVSGEILDKGEGLWKGHIDSPGLIIQHRNDLHLHLHTGQSGYIRRASGSYGSGRREIVSFHNNGKFG